MMNGIRSLLAVLVPAGALLALVILPAGCGGGGAPAPAESPWEVRVVTDADTVVVPTGESGAAPAVPPAPPAGEGEWEVAVESPLDSLRHAAEEREALLEAGEGEHDAAEGTGADPAATEAREYTYGHRIQILAASSLVQAEAESVRADSLFAHPVHIEYEAPFFKVRLGDFLVRSRAERVLEAEVRPVYPQAWVVDTMVRLTSH